MQIKRIHIILFSILLLSVIIGFAFQFIGNSTPDYTLNEKKTSNAVQQELSIADENIRQYAAIKSSDSLKRIQNDLSHTHGHTVFVFRNSELIYWSNNQFSTDFSEIKDDDNWHLMELSNAQVLYKWYSSEYQYGFLYIIPVKSSYPYENKYLSNSFNQAFKLADEIQLSGDAESDGFKIKDVQGNYLFTLLSEAGNNAGSSYSLWGFISFCIAFLVFILIFVNLSSLFIRKKLDIKTFTFATLISGLVITLAAYSDFPDIFFTNQLFSVYQYAVNRLISSFTHLTVFSIFLLAVIHVYHQKVEKSGKYLPLFEKVAFFLFILSFFELIKSLIFHSSIQFQILWIQDLNFIHVWAHLILFLFMLGLYFFLQIVFLPQAKGKSLREIITNLLLLSLVLAYEFITDSKHAPYFLLMSTVIVGSGYLLKYQLKTKLNFSILTGFLVICCLLIFFLTYRFSEEKKFIRYQVLSENILVNGNSENDPIAELLLEELQKQLSTDKNIALLADSGTVLQRYIYNKHLRGFWNKYQIHIDIINYPSEAYDKSFNFVQFSGKRLGETGFYSLPGLLYDMSYVGLIKTGTLVSTTDTAKILLFQFQPKRNFRSYSFPDLLVNSDNEAHSKPDISIAKYNNNELIYSDSRYAWSDYDDKLNTAKPGFFKLKRNGSTFYQLSNSGIHILIIELRQAEIKSYLIYLTFIILAFIILSKIIFSIYKNAGNEKSKLKLTTRFQLVFIFLLLMSFLGIFLFSVSYIRTKYEKEQIEQAEQKKKYIQKSLQDLYFWTNNFSNIDVDRLNNDLEELAYIYQTDINIYNNAGLLIGSSQNLIFSRNLVSRLMSPKVFFSKGETGNTYENIGNLKYLAAYTEFLNGDFLRLGYISIPQYFSQTEINAEIESYLTAIIQIYFLIIVLSIILILIAGKQLSEPLRLLEDKLRSMYFGGKNEKIEYRWNDEIGQLVEQYNRTVDELEKSTGLLLQAERETAWRTMARQVAHEINNPLTPMKLTIQQLQRTRKIGDREFEAYFEKATKTLIEQIDNLSRIAGTFSQFARLPESKYMKVDVAAKLFSVTELFRNNHENITISYQGIENQVFVKGDPDQLIQVFNNIFKNACQAIGDDAEGQINVIITVNKKKVYIAISDNGSGISEDIKPEIFRPSFTTKSTGMGLGLSISKNIIELMGGIIEFESESDAGTTFRIELEQF